MLEGRRIPAAVLTMALLTGATWVRAQGGKTNTNTAQAVLHLQVTVAPVVFSHRTAEKSAEPVSYLVPIVKRQQETIVRFTPLRELKGRFACGDACDGVLKTATFIAK